MSNINRNTEAVLDTNRQADLHISNRKHFPKIFH